MTSLETSNLTTSPLGTLLDSSAAALNLYKYGRRPFIFFALSISLSLLFIQFIYLLPFVRGVNPTHPEWTESFHVLEKRIQFLFRTLIFAGGFVLGVSQAVKKQKDIFNPDLTHVVLYGKLIVILFAIEFTCTVLLSPRKNSKPISESISGANAFLTWLRNTSQTIAEQMIAGAGAGFGYGYLVRGAGVLFKAY